MYELKFSLRICNNILMTLGQSYENARYRRKMRMKKGVSHRCFRTEGNHGNGCWNDFPLQLKWEIFVSWQWIACCYDKTLSKPNLQRKEFITYYLLETIFEGSQDKNSNRNLESDTKAEIMVGNCLLVSFTWINHFGTYITQDCHTRGAITQSVPYPSTLITNQKHAPSHMSTCLS